jgi:hypothetical protein
VGFGLCLAVLYLLNRNLWDRPLGSIAFGELVATGGFSLLWGWVGFKLLSSWRNDDDPRHINQLMGWGLVGIAIAVIAGAAVLWLWLGLEWRPSIAR